MATSQQADEYPIHHVLLPDDDFSDFLAYLIKLADCDLECRF
jgi:hypothetical protein